MKRLVVLGPWSLLPGALSVLTLLAGAPALSAGQPNEAEKLFREMEKKITSAKTIECRFEGKTEFFKLPKGEFKGTLLLGEGNKCNLEASMYPPGNPPGFTDKGTTICNGLKMHVIPDGKPTSVHNAPKDLNAQLRAALALTGLRHQIMAKLYNLDHFHAPGDWKPIMFKLVGKGKVGGRDAQWINYTLPQTLFSIKVNLWLDAKTNLPLKRDLGWATLDGYSTMAETYTDLILDGKIDAKKFELPKE